MNAKQLREVIKIHYEKKLPILIFGHPGIGKSQITRETAQELKVKFVDIRLSLLEPTDLRGFPYIDKEKNIAKWAIPEFLPQGNPDSNGILMLDEINLAPPSVQNAAYQLVLDRQLGEYTLPPGWSIVAAGNILLKEGYISQIRSALLSRFSVVELDIPTVEEWVKEYAIPRGIDPRIVSFLFCCPDKIYEEPVEKNKNFPNPRNWENLSKLIKGCPADSPVFEQLVVSRVGSAVASQFSAFLHIDIDWKSWLDESREPQIPKNLDGVCFLIAILALEPARVEGLMRLILALEKDGQSELAMLGVQFLGKLLPVDQIVRLKRWKEVANIFGKYFPF